ASAHRRKASRHPPCAGPSRSAGPASGRVAAVDVLSVDPGADGVVVLANLLEAVALVDRLRLEVPAPDAEPDRSLEGLLEPREGGAHQRAPVAAAMPFVCNIQSTELAVARPRVAVGELAGACEHV